ncbi:MAG: FAD-binding oxidoreductase [Hyphomicrobiales bacterium]|nr:FAD-binding oxidoreductase [Hyphomicrobiales bacterium]
MINETEVVVIGSGALGSSVAFHLAKARRLAVTLLDMHDLASQTSPRAAGLTSQVRRSELMTQLAMLAVKKIESFAEETGEPLTFQQPGALKIARLAEHEAQLKAEVARGRRMGIELDFISLEEARRKMPFLETKGVRAITYSPTDLYLEPAQIPVGYSRAAGKLGAALLPHTRVIGINIKDRAVAGVVTDKGEISCRFVVDAAGAWTRLVASLASSRVPIMPTRHQLVITQAIDGVEANQPITRIIDANVYVRPDNGGLMLGGYEKNPVQYDMARVAPSFDIKDMPLDLDVLRGLASSVREQLPVFAGLGQDLPLREHRGGLPTMTADGEHVVGPVPEMRGLFVAGGCCVGGLSIAPAVGEVLAEWILSGRAPMDLAALAPGRASADLRPEERLRDACRDQYSHHYWERHKTATEAASG